MTMDLRRRASRQTPLTAADYDATLDAVEAALTTLDDGLKAESAFRATALADLGARVEGHADQVGAVTDAGRALIAAPDAAVQRALLGLVVSASAPADAADGTIWLDIGE